MKVLQTVLLVMTVSSSAFAQSNRIDTIGQDAPELARFGEFDIGVRTLELSAPERVDVINSVAGEVTNYYDRPLTVEIWYPAALGAGQSAGGDYFTETRNLDINATLHGRAVRDAAPNGGAGPYPLVIISHGYPGNRFLLSHLGENLASKGYVVASIDHTDSTYQHQEPIASTLYNRPLDQRFVLSSIADMGADNTSFLAGLVDTDNTGLVGFSMGGYGAVNNIGGAISTSMIDAPISPPNELLADHTTQNRNYKRNLDPRIKAAVAIAPWGMNTGFFSQSTLSGVQTPVLFVAGDKDVTAGYENGTRAIFESTVNADRYLLTFVDGGHSVAAPIPMPVEILQDPEKRGAGHYTDAAWDSVIANNVLQHFSTVFFDLHLKGMENRAEYLSQTSEAVWKGFVEGTTEKLLLEHKSKGE